MCRATETMGMIIRRLRREHGLTQEELAASIGVTAQAVSKWEKDLGMPDISQIVPLAGAFNVRTDVLFGLEVDGADAAIERAAALEREAGYSAEESVGLWRELKRLYPRNCGVRFRLAGALLRCGDHKRAAEQYEYILGECTDGELRAKTLDMLCFCYHNIGDTENAVRVAMLCPPVRINRHSLLAKIGGYEKHNDVNDELMQWCICEICLCIMRTGYPSAAERHAALILALHTVDALYGNNRPERVNTLYTEMAQETGG